MRLGLKKAGLIWFLPSTKTTIASLLIQPEQSYRIPSFHSLIRSMCQFTDADTFIDH